MRTFDIPQHFRSEKIAAIKAKRKAADPRKQDYSPSRIDFGSMELLLARHFGFCYGVENAIERAYRAIAENPGKRIFLLSQMIHNPSVNKDLEDNGIRFLMDTEGNELLPFKEVNREDIVLIPAFGTTVEMEKKLLDKGVELSKYDTTCPFVEKVWKRSEKLSSSQHTILIHGKPIHEETRATFSHAGQNGPALVIKNMEEAQQLAALIITPNSEAFEKHFSGRYNEAFKYPESLERIGVVNQTTMLASDTQAIADFFRQTLISKYGEEQIKNHFADTRDTLCYATNDNQSATLALLEENADLAIVVGGYNSSNTSHIVELCEQKFPTYFINSDTCLNQDAIAHFNYEQKTHCSTKNWIPKKEKPTVIITSGASCPDSLLEAVLNRLLEILN